MIKLNEFITVTKLVMFSPVSVWLVCQQDCKKLLNGFPQNLNGE